MALELTEDVASVYAAADEQTKRSLNQAFFSRIYVMPDWDEDGEKAARVDRAELTAPYAELLAAGLVDGVLAEAEAIRQGSERAEDASDEEAPSAVSIFLQMVETPGIEPGSAVA